jgi:hypothetical protein
MISFHDPPKDRLSLESINKFQVRFNEFKLNNIWPYFTSHKVIPFNSFIFFLSSVYTEKIAEKIILIRGHKVLMDADLANLYGVPTKVLNQAVRRNKDRFPDDFIFQLSKREDDSLRSQSVTSKGRGGRRYFPYAFTEQGVAMLSTVLNSPRAIQVNIEIMRVFVRLRRMIASYNELDQRINELDQNFQGHEEKIQAIFEIISRLIEPPPDTSRRQIGFKPERE